MNKLTKKQHEIWRHYRKNGTKFKKCKVNKCEIHMNGTLEHEKKKLEICYELRDLEIPFICEAVQVGTDERIDIVNLNNGDHIEIETDMKRAKRHLDKPYVVIIPCGWTKNDPKWIKIVEDNNAS